MKHELLIRPARIEDQESIFVLANQLSEFIKIDKDIFNLNYPDLINNPDYCILVAEHEGSVIGYLSSYFHKAIYANGLVIYIDEIVILKDKRKLKLGTELMAELEKIARNKKCILISLATAGARGFYEKLGYTSKAGYFKKYL